jgi:hypothetical protein
MQVVTAGSIGTTTPPGELQKLTEYRNAPLKKSTAPPPAPDGNRVRDLRASNALTRMTDTPRGFPNRSRGDVSHLISWTLGNTDLRQNLRFESARRL